MSQGPNAKEPRQNASIDPAVDAPEAPELAQTSARTPTTRTSSEESVPVPTGASPLGARAKALVDALSSAFIDHVQRALDLELDHSPITLAYVDHYLTLARNENREPILSLLASQAGAYFGELVRRDIGGFWIGDGKDPRALRLLLEPQFIHFSPVDMAFEAIIGDSLEDDDPRHPEGRSIDAAFHLEQVEANDDDSNDPEAKLTATPSSELDENDTSGSEISDAQWIDDRLSELTPLPADQYYSLTGRFETLRLILELLATKHLQEGREPRSLSFDDYLQALHAN